MSSQDRPKVASEDPCEPLPGEEELSAYLDSLSFERNLSAHTIRNYRNDISDYLRWAKRKGMDPFSVTHRRFRRYLGEMDAARYSKRTVNRHLSALKGFFSWLNVTGAIDVDPISALSGPKSAATLPKVIRNKEMRAFLCVHAGYDEDGMPKERTAEDIRDQAVLELLYACGARVSEVANLKLRDVDLGSQLVKVFGKGSKERVIPIHDLAVASLMEYRDHARDELLGGRTSESFFVSSRGNAYSDQAIRRMFKKTLAAAGLDPTLSPHAMRHTFASDVLSGGADLRSVQEMLGHASLSTTQIYTHVSPERLKAIHSQAHPRG